MINFKIPFGYLGYFLIIKFSWRFIHKITSIVYKYFFSINKMLSNYKRGNYNFPEQTNFIQLKCVNLVVINFSNINNSVQIFQLINKFNEEGFRIVLIINRLDKNKISISSPNIITKSYSTDWDEEQFNNKIKQKIKKIKNGLGIHFSVYVHTSNNFVNNLLDNNLSFYNNHKETINKVLLLKICINEMLFNKGKSLILEINKNHPQLSQQGIISYNLFKYLFKILKEEYKYKIDFLNLNNLLQN